MIGQTISHYRIIEKLGEGGMGIVYKAQDLTLDRLVALKFLPVHLTRSEEEKQRFIHEAKAASALDHPNICNIHEIDTTEDGQLFIAMSHYEGETLNKKVESEQLLPIAKVIEIAIQITQGLTRAHESHIIHRDLKPANIMITNREEVKILDFGLAIRAGQTRITQESTTLGTIAYMSPEQAKGEEVDHRSDIWSLGVILYEILTGQLPFKGDYESAIIYSILNDSQESVTARRTGVPMELERILNKCLKKKPAERYQHTDELLSDLRLLLSEPGSSVSTVDPVKGSFNIKRLGFMIATVIIVAIFLYVILNLIPKESETYDSIAVLPLINLSGDRSQEYFSDGMTEAIISELANISALKVISRTSVMQYRDTNKSIPQIAEELDVDAILEGSVLRAGKKVRITVQLIQAMEDRHLWAKNYERKLQDILFLQRAVAKDIAAEIRIKLSENEKRTLQSAYQVNPLAYEEYLRGLFHWNKRTKDDLQKSIQHYQKAIEIDDDYAEAYAGLAQTYIVLVAWQFLDPNEGDTKASIFAKKALELNNNLPSGYTALAATLEGEWRWKEAEDFYKRAIDLSPNYSTAHQWYAELLSALGRHDEAVKEMQYALALDPLSMIINHNLGLIYYYAHDFHKAELQYKKTMELDENFGSTDYFLYLNYLATEDYDQAVKALQKFFSTDDELKHYTAVVAEVYKSSGIAGLRQYIIDQMHTIAKYRNTFELAMHYAALGQNDAAFYWLEHMILEKSPRIKYLGVQPGFENIRDDPRFNHLLERMGLN